MFLNHFLHKKITRKTSVNRLFLIDKINGSHLSLSVKFRLIKATTGKPCQQEKNADSTVFHTMLHLFCCQQQKLCWDYFAVQAHPPLSTYNIEFMTGFFFAKTFQSFVSQLY